MAYLESRGLAQAASPFRLGVVREPLPEHRQYTGRLAIPFLTPSGVVAMRFRALDESKAKMLSVSGQQPRMYNVAALHTGGPAVAICEGEFDAMALTLAGLPAVGITGTSAWLEHFPRCFTDFDTVYIITDNDVKPEVDGEPQKNAGQELAGRISKSLANGRIITPPPNVDVNSWIQRDGVESVLNEVGYDAA